MDVESLAKQLILQNMTPEQQTAVLDGIKASLAQAKDVQKRKIGENVQVVVETLKKLEADIRARYDETGKAIEKRVASIKDGKDGKNGQDGRNGKDGKPGRDGAAGAKGQSGQDGTNGRDGKDGISISDAHIDFDGSLIITLSDGKVLNVGEVVSQDIAEKINVIRTMSTNGAVAVKEEGTTLTSGVKSINFVGAGITATTSGDDVTVTVSSGSGTVTSVAATVPAFLSVAGSPITTSGTLAISLSGTALPVANGGTGVTTSTGTTNVVLSNSPVLVTPDLGTPSALVGTNITGTATAFTASNVTTNANLTGDVTSVGNASTLATVNSNVGAFTNANITVNAKGLITAAANGSPGGVTSVTGTSPVVSSGGTTPAISLAAGYGDTLNPYASKTANFVLAAPDGTAGVPTFRAVVAADIPTLNQNTTGSAATLTTARNIYGNSFNGSAALTQVIASTFGGTGNGFTKFTGATTTEKTYTLPDASSTIVVQGGALGTPSSGTVTNLTGTASININGTVGATTAASGAFTTLSATGVATLSAGSAAAPAITTSGDTNTGIFFPAADTIAFTEGGVEAMRIDSNSNLRVGTTAGILSTEKASINAGSAGGYGLCVSTSTTGGFSALLLRNNDGNSTSNQVFFVHGASTFVGSITTTSSTTAYNTSSDYRLKENIAPMTGALATVSLLKPVTYKWKIDSSNGQGFIAHELAEVVPDCVTGEKDAVDADGNIKPQGIDTSFLIATLTAAIQEQQALITSLTDRIAALEAR